MSNKPSESSSRKTAQKPSAISKQVLKPNAIPQTVRSNLTSNLIAENNNNAVRGKPTQPLRSTKVSQKLVLFPHSSTDNVETTMSSVLPEDSNTGPEELEEEREERRFSTTSIDDHRQQQWQDEQNQPRSAGVPLPIEWTFGSRTAAERMTKDERELALLPRAAAYCTGEGYDLNRLRPFLRQHHRVSPRLYDECLYAAYHFPLRTLRPDKENLYNIKVRSNVPSAPNNNRYNEADEDEMDYDEDNYNARAEAPTIVQPRPGQPYPDYYQNRKDYFEEDIDIHRQHEEEDLRQQEVEQEQRLQDEFQKQQNEEQEGIFENPFSQVKPTNDEDDVDIPSPRSQNDIQDQLVQVHGIEIPVEEEEETTKPVREPFKGGEVFIFDYGVVVFWNFRRAEELLMLEDFMGFSINPFRDNPDEDMQIEEIHFQYDTSQMKPRIFNDMITLKSSNHMIKLTLSHGLSQSAVVARYEDIMDKTIEDTKHLPKEMAETGRLGKTRSEITKINGQLFALRMNVNLVSNVLGNLTII